MSAEPAIVFSGCGKRFGAAWALRPTTLGVPTGSTFGLIGPNGAGKTTALSLVSGFLHPSEGSLRVLGHAPGQQEALGRRRAALPQDAALPANDPVGEALVFWARLMGLSRADAERQSRESLEAVGLPESWAVRCGALSHGMAKRVAVAQAFLGDPDLVLLDEPTAGLDPQSAHQMRRLLVQQKRAGRTLVLSSHNLTELEELCDRACILDRGRVVAEGPMAELTGAVAEVTFLLGAPPPLDALATLAVVGTAAWDASRGLLTVGFDKAMAPETVIAAVLGALLAGQVPIRGVQKGRGLEHRVLDLLGR